METQIPTNEPTIFNETRTSELEIAEEEHEYDAVTAVLINVTLITCLLLAYYVKRFRVYSLPESAGALLIGVLVGGLARLCTNKLVLFEFVSVDDGETCGRHGCDCTGIGISFISYRTCGASHQKYFSLCFYPQSSSKLDTH